MAKLKTTARKSVIAACLWRTRFIAGKRVPPSLVEALRNEEEDPIEVPVEAPMEDEPMMMDDEPIEIEDSNEELMEEEV